MHTDTRSHGHGRQSFLEGKEGGRISGFGAVRKE